MGFKRIPSGLEGQVLALTHQTQDRATARPPKALKDLNFNLKHSKVRLQHRYKVLLKLLFLKLAKFFSEKCQVNLSLKYHIFNSNFLKIKYDTINVNIRNDMEFESI